MQPYKYRWSDELPHGSSPNDLAPGNYTVTIYYGDACEHLENISIVNKGGVKAKISNSTNASCFGTQDGAATVEAVGTGNYTYVWSPSGGNAATAKNLKAGSYSVAVSDEFGCSANASIVITQPDAIPATITKHDATCGNKNGEASVNVTNPSGNYTYLWTPGNYHTSNISELASGAYTVTVTNEKGCFTAPVIIDPRSVPQIKAVEHVDVLCNGQKTGSATATAVNGTPSYTYKWTNGTNSYTGNPLQNVPSGTYQLIITDDAGCTATGSVTISEPVLLTNTVKITAATCGNANGTAAITESGGTAPYTYSWSPIAGNGPSASGLAAGDYIVYISDKNHCEDKVNIHITNAGSLTASIGNISNVTCNGGNNGSVAVNATGTAPYSYTWSPAGGNEQTATNLRAGNYTVSVTDQQGCTATATAQITEPTPITTQLTAVPATCGNNNGSAQVVAGGGAGTYSFSWQPGNYTGDKINNVSAGTYAVTVKDANGCSKTDEIIIRSSPAVSINKIAASEPLCKGQATGSAAANIAGGTAPYTYKWTNGTNSYTGNPLQNVLSGTYRLTVTDDAGCTATGSVIISEPALLTNTVKITTATCGNANGTAAITESGGTAPYTYLWAPSGGDEASATKLSPGDYKSYITDSHQCTDSVLVHIENVGGVSAAIVNTVDVSCNDGNNGSATVSAAGSAGPFAYAWLPAGGTTATASNLKPGDYTVTVTDRQGCTATASTHVGQPSGLKTTVTVTGTTCNNNNGSATIATEGGTAPYSYAWSGINQTTPAISNLAASHYVVTVTDAHGCSQIDSAVIAPSTNPAVDSITHTDVLCNGNKDGTAAAHISNGTQPYRYLWTNGSDSFTTAAIQRLAAGGYQLKVTDAAGCTATSGTTIAEPYELKLSFVATPTTCGINNGSVVLNVTGGTIPYQYRWSGGNKDKAPSNLAAGSYHVLCTDANGCTASAKDIKINPSQPLKISLGHDTTICPGTNLVLSPGNFKSYVWHDNSSSPAYRVMQTALYAVTVTDSIGCSATASVKVEVNCKDIVFPNAFTPNGDGNNDFFGPLGTLHEVKEYTLTIYNRWGQLVFSTNNPYIKWDGKFNSSDGATGTYVWIASYSFNRQQKRLQKGTITIIK